MNIIGISGSVFEEGSVVKSFVNRTYVDSVVRSGGVPFIMPICENENIIKKMIENVDGVIMTGGVDIHPFKFNEEPNPKIGEISKERDDFDFLIMKHAFENNKPIFGICRGIQLINVFFGGTLIQDINSQKNTKILHSQTAPRDVATHKIKIKKDSIISDIFGTSAEVNSFHHQAINKLSKDFKITSEANDGIVESIEYKKKDRFIFGVQWHPECMTEKDEKMQNIFSMFVDICKN